MGDRPRQFWNVLQLFQRRADPQVAEIKRMYVIPEARGRGIARQVLIALEAEAQQLGVSRLVLETGLRQVEALALYRRAGFVEIPLFGEYIDSPLSICIPPKTLCEAAG